VEIETSILVGVLIVVSPSSWMTNRLWKRCGEVRWPIYFCRLNYISEKAEARVVIFCTHTGYNKS